LQPPNVQKHKRIPIRRRGSIEQEIPIFVDLKTFITLREQKKEEKFMQKITEI
jgi:hypothetical protein